MDKRVFWAVLAALLVFSLLVVATSAWQEYRLQQAQRAAWQGVLDAASNPDPWGLRAQRAQQLDEDRQAILAHRMDDQRFQADAQQRLLDQRRLGPQDRCVGGVVIRVVGSTYTQLAAHCSGGFADVAIH